MNPSFRAMMRISAIPQATRDNSESSGKTTEIPGSFHAATVMRLVTDYLKPGTMS